MSMAERNRLAEEPCVPVLGAGDSADIFLSMIPAVPCMSSHIPLAFENGHDDRTRLRTATG